MSLEANSNPYHDRLGVACLRRSGALVDGSLRDPSSGHGVTGLLCGFAARSLPPHALVPTSHHHIFPIMQSQTLTILLAGGIGSRLNPLTAERAKPGVPYGGKYRIIDFTLSNCLHSGLRRVLVLTQYKSHSLQKHQIGRAHV